jgi:molybdopterin synthase sulfur carrier subunit
MLVKFFATYRDITKCSSCVMPAPPHVLALLTEVCARFGPAMRARLLTADGLALSADAVVLVNGRHIVHLAGLETALTEEDVVAIFPLVAGG